MVINQVACHMLVRLTLMSRKLKITLGKFCFGKALNTEVQLHKNQKSKIKTSLTDSQLGYVLRHVQEHLVNLSVNVLIKNKFLYIKAWCIHFAW